MTKPTNETLLAASIQDENLSTNKGETVFRLPEGASIHDLPCHPDDRGLVCELFDPRWSHLDHPFEFAYFVTLKSDCAKGWAMHLEHWDRYCLIHGEMLTVLYDARENSATFGCVFEVFLSERRRRMLKIPPGVWHADLNFGSTEATIANFPTIKYNHAKPDKYRLPLHTDLIPYKVPPGMRGY